MTWSATTAATRRKPSWERLTSSATSLRLGSGDFEGGKAGAVKVLGKLGFTVRQKDATSQRQLTAGIRTGIGPSRRELLPDPYRLVVGDGCRGCRPGRVLPLHPALVGVPSWSQCPGAVRECSHGSRQLGWPASSLSALAGPQEPGL
jgi:hypothetical protein